MRDAWHRLESVRGVSWCFADQRRTGCFPESTVSRVSDESDPVGTDGLVFPRSRPRYSTRDPSARSSAQTYRGSITKQGSVLVRWSAVEAVSRYHGGAPIRDHYRRVAERRGRNIGRVAAARKLLTLVYYGLRDGEIRCLRDAG